MNRDNRSAVRHFHPEFLGERFHELYFTAAQVKRRRL
jgi:hypothetical protein